MNTIARIVRFIFFRVDNPEGTYRVVKHRNDLYYPMVKGWLFWVPLVCYDSGNKDADYVSVCQQSGWHGVCGKANEAQAKRLIALHHQQCVENAAHHAKPVWVFVSSIRFSRAPRHPAVLFTESEYDEIHG